MAGLPAETWQDLNDYLRSCNDEAQVKSLLKKYVSEGRLQWALRVHGRLQVIRSQRERKEIKANCMEAQASR